MRKRTYLKAFLQNIFRIVQSKYICIFYFFHIFFKPRLNKILKNFRRHPKKIYTWKMSGDIFEILYLHLRVFISKYHNKEVWVKGELIEVLSKETVIIFFKGIR